MSSNIEQVNEFEQLMLRAAAMTVLKIQRQRAVRLGLTLYRLNVTGAVEPVSAREIFTEDGKLR